MVTLIYTLFIIRLAELCHAVEITVDDLQVFLVVTKTFRAPPTAPLSLHLVRDCQQSNELRLGLRVNFLSETVDLPARDGGDDLK